MGAFVTFIFPNLFYLAFAAIHLGIVFLIFAIDNVLPPFFVLQIPLNRLFDTILKFSFWQPAQFPMNLGWIYSITTIMALSVLYMNNQTLRLTQFLTNNPHNIYIALFIVTAYI